MAKVIVNFSENPAFGKGSEYDLRTFDDVIGRIDLDYQTHHDKYHDMFGGYEGWDKVVEKSRNNEPLTAEEVESLKYVFPYNKVDFTIRLDDGQEYHGRYDVGDGIGGLQEYLMNANAPTVVRSAVMHEVDPELYLVADIMELAREFPALNNEGSALFDKLQVYKDLREGAIGPYIGEIGNLKRDIMYNRSKYEGLDKERVFETLDNIAIRMGAMFERYKAPEKEFEVSKIEFLDFNKMHEAGIEGLKMGGEISANGELFREKDVLEEDCSQPLAVGRCKIVSIKPNIKDYVTVKLEGNINVTLSQDELAAGRVEESLDKLLEHPKEEPKIEEPVSAVAKETPTQEVAKSSPEAKKAPQTAEEIVRDSRKEVVEKMLAMMEKGKIPWHCGWDRGMFRPHNPFSQTANHGNGYRAGNRIRLMVEAHHKGYKDPRWMTFKQAKEHGYNVKRGEKGTTLEKWVFGKYKTVIDENEPDPDLREKQVWVNYSHPYVNYFKVFNAEQIEGIPPYEPEKMLDISKESELDAVIMDMKESSECPIVEEAQSRAFYSPDEDRITLPLMSSFTSKREFLATMLHEMSHSTGHESRLNRDIKNGFGTPDYAREELRAELGSVFTQGELGISLSDGVLENHTAYVQSWIAAIKKDPDELFRAAADADKITERLVSNYEAVIGRGQELEQTQEKEQAVEIKHKHKEVAMDIMH